MTVRGSGGGGRKGRKAVGNPRGLCWERWASTSTRLFARCRLYSDCTALYSEFYC